LVGSVLLNIPTNALLDVLTAIWGGLPLRAVRVSSKTTEALLIDTGIAMFPSRSVVDVSFIELDLYMAARTPATSLFNDSTTPVIGSAGGLLRYEPLQICGKPSVSKPLISRESAITNPDSTVTFMLSTSTKVSTPTVV
jgi:hypothetical protein